MVLKRKELAKAVETRMDQLKLKSQPAFVKWLSEQGCQVNQSTVNRLINRQIKEASVRVKEICKYAGIDWKDYVTKVKPHKSRTLMGALESAWDGSQAQERWLARMIRTAGAAPPLD
ncbi:MAG TPA: hypothetical protein VGD88_16395 [Opitutaceae bacterium]